MKILVATFAFNEKKYLPPWVNYYRRQGCDILVIDNFSTDGMYDWLVKNKIRTGKVNTNETFDLLTLQRNLVQEIHKIKPDWVLYGGCDLYFIFKAGIQKIIEEAESGGYNLIEVRHFEAFNTGEPEKTPLTKNFFYMREHGRLRMIGRYGHGFDLVADEIVVPNPKVLQTNDILINYGMCKPKAEREVTLARRRKAWANGLHKGWGTHYEPAQKINWKWDQNTLRDMKQRPELELIKQTW